MFLSKPPLQQAPKQQPPAQRAGGGKRKRGVEGLAAAPAGNAGAAAAKGPKLRDAGPSSGRGRGPPPVPFGTGRGRTGASAAAAAAARPAGATAAAQRSAGAGCIAGAAWGRRHLRDVAPAAQPHSLAAAAADARPSWMGDGGWRRVGPNGPPTARPWLEGGGPRSFGASRYHEGPLHTTLPPADAWGEELALPAPRRLPPAAEQSWHLGRGSPEHWEEPLRWRQQQQQPPPPPALHQQRAWYPGDDHRHWQPEPLEQQLQLHPRQHGPVHTAQEGPGFPEWEPPSLARQFRQQRQQQQGLQQRMHGCEDRLERFEEPAAVLHFQPAGEGSFSDAPHSGHAPLQQPPIMGGFGFTADTARSHDKMRSQQWAARCGSGGGGRGGFSRGAGAGGSRGQQSNHNYPLI